MFILPVCIVDRWFSIACYNLTYICTFAFYRNQFYMYFRPIRTQSSTIIVFKSFNSNQMIVQRNLWSLHQITIKVGRNIKNWGQLARAWEKYVTAHSSRAVQDELDRIIRRKWTSMQLTEGAISWFTFAHRFPTAFDISAESRSWLGHVKPQFIPTSF